ncbi:MAG: NAD(P)H-quinone oxidoreductase [Proteobacteria bacterium]|nr:NAD(P)H-quinone oxidoreductase [Pseudomonadota bacterium]
MAFFTAFWSGIWYITFCSLLKRITTSGVSSMPVFGRYLFGDSYGLLPLSAKVAAGMSAAAKTSRERNFFIETTLRWRYTARECSNKPDFSKRTKAEPMRLIGVKQQGSHYTLEVQEGKKPTPAEHEVLIKVAAAGVNRADIFQAEGIYPAPEGASPVLGMEVAGEVVALGKGVKICRLGDKVVALMPGGGYAEYAVARESEILPLPSGLKEVQGAALPEAMYTAYLNLFEIGQLKPGAKVLVHGGASGVGTMAIQMAAVMGAEVFATAGTKAKCKAIEALGAKRAICYKDEDFVAVLKKAVPEGVDIVLDIVAGSYLEKNVKVLAPRGKLVQIAVLEGSKTEINLAAVLMKNISITGSTLRSRSILERHEITRSLYNSFWPMLEAGRIKPVVDKLYPIAEANEAHQRMKANQNIGKIILTF